MVVGLSALDEEALVRILTQPKNALVKQYVKMFEFDGVALEMEEDAIRAVAKRAIALKTGARGLRSILEGVMLDVMYELPERDDVETVRITLDVIEGRAEPLVEYKKTA